MEDDIGTDILYPAVDQESEASAESSRSESTLSKSVESGVTVDSSRGHSCESCGNVDTRLDGCTGWTNEKHNSYLDHLETSFVRQFYYLLGGKNRRSVRSHDLPANSNKSTDQFAVLQNGYWQKVNFGKKRTYLDTSSDFYLGESPLTSHFAHPNENHAVRTAVQGNLLRNEEINCCGDKAFPRASMRNPVGKIEYRLCCEFPDGSTAEASGQNFVDEDKEDNPSSSTVSKRLKRDAKIDNPISDQVVPIGNAHQRDFRSANQVFSERPQGFNFQKADDRRCFLGGS